MQGRIIVQLNPALGDPPPILPPTGGPEIRVNPSNAASLVAGAPEKAHIIFASGTYRQLSITPRNGQRFEADGDVVWDGEFARGHAIAGVRQDISILGIRFTRYGPAEPRFQGNGRLTEERAVINSNRSWPNWSKRWICYHVRVDNCPMREAMKVHEGCEWHHGHIQNVSGVGIAGRGPGLRISNSVFRDINTSGAASHHHTGGIKIVGGNRDGISGPGFWPASKDIRIWKCEGYNLVKCRGLVWCDWDVDEVVIEDFLVDGCEHEGITLECSANGIVRRGMIKNTNRRQYWAGAIPVWNGALMLQNTKSTEVHDIEFHGGAHTMRAVTIAHHGRPHWDSYIGRFIGQHNYIHDCTRIGTQGRDAIDISSGHPLDPCGPARPGATRRAGCNDFAAFA